MTLYDLYAKNAEKDLNILIKELKSLKKITARYEAIIKSQKQEVKKLKYTAAYNKLPRSKNGPRR